MLGKTKPRATPIGYAAVAIVVAIILYTYQKSTKMSIAFILSQNTYFIRSEPVGGKFGGSDRE